ncbi:MAG TPA: alkaline phosphatase family protein [Xanthobacteraceae bacterium]|nr:alkaline phosphatase family protein [Xanthobacteraceae bacterium]
MRASQIFGLLAASAFTLLAVPAWSASHHPPRRAAQALPKPGHVFIIVLENEGYDVTFGRQSPATYMKRLARQGALLPNYYGIGHYSLDNYLAMVSGQAPNPITQADCQDYVDFQQTGTGEHGQALGKGCIFPKGVSTIVNQPEAGGLTWKGYMEDMGNDPKRESSPCGQPIGHQPDSTQHAKVGDQYAARHNPFVYFHAITDDVAGCDAHVVNFSALAADLKHERTTPHYVFITPNLCHDGHDPQENEKDCVDHEPGGLISANKFLAEQVPAILASPAFKHDGLLIITFDEADFDTRSDEKARQKHNTLACCHELPAPNIPPGATVFETPDEGPGVVGPGGGQIGTVLVSRYIKPGTVSEVPYNHYSMLRSIEDFFDVGHLGYAGQKGLRPFGDDIFTEPEK